MHHFIGKDIVNFHALFWPAVLDGSGFRTPTRIHTHGFITVNGAKMSKSKGTFINAATCLEHIDPECLRYYYATKLNGTIDDFDINFDDFAQRVNSDPGGQDRKHCQPMCGLYHQAIRWAVVGAVARRAAVGALRGSRERTGGTL